MREPQGRGGKVEGYPVGEERGAPGEPGVTRAHALPKASLVPVFSLGENELFQHFPNPPGSGLRSAQEALQPLRSAALQRFHGPLGLLLPFCTPIHTLGEPRPPPLRSPPAYWLRSSGPAPSPRGAVKVPGCRPLFGRAGLTPFGNRPGPELCPGRSRGWAGRARAAGPNHRPSGVAFCLQRGPRSQCSEARRRWTRCPRSTWNGSRSCSRSTRRLRHPGPPAPASHLGPPPRPFRCPRRLWAGREIKRGNRAAACVCAPPCLRWS